VCARVRACVRAYVCVLYFIIRQPNRVFSVQLYIVICGLSGFTRFSGASAKLRKTTISFVMSACPSVRPHGTTRLPRYGFGCKLILSFFLENLRRKFTFMTMSRYILLKMRNALNEICRENQNTYFTSHNFSKIVPCMR
jgi:hypothetical protein